MQTTPMSRSSNGPRKDRSLPDTPVRASKAHHRVHENFTKLIRFVQDLTSEKPLTRERERREREKGE